MYVGDGVGLRETRSVVVFLVVVYPIARQLVFKKLALEVTRVVSFPFSIKKKTCGLQANRDGYTDELNVFLASYPRYTLKQLIKYQ